MDQVFGTRQLPAVPDAVAPDGSDVRVLLQLSRGSMAHFELAAGQVSRAVAHRSVEEIWYVVAGHGQMWRRQDQREETVDLRPGTCVSIPVGTHFQFRADVGGSLAAVGVTMPPWPGETEAYEVPGAWPWLVPGPASPLRQRLEASLRDALRARDAVARSALRSALAAIDNATAVPPGQPPAAAASLHVAGAVAGLGAAEAERRWLTEAGIENIVRGEVAERQAAARDYDQAGQRDRAGRLRREADILESILHPRRP